LHFRVKGRTSDHDSDEPSIRKTTHILRIIIANRPEKYIT